MTTALRQFLFRKELGRFLSSLSSHSLLFFFLQTKTIVTKTSWTILDLSVAMAYAMLNAYGKHNRSLSAAAAMLRGYHSVRPLSQKERQDLPLLIACRLSCSATLGAYSYAQNPGNEYLLLHATPAWNALELIWGTDPVRRSEIHGMIHGFFDQACAKCEVDEKTGVIDCSDLMFPDPSVSDPFAGSRSSSNKRQKTD